jgi:hypothetical protein
MMSPGNQLKRFSNFGLLNADQIMWSKRSLL